MDTRDYIYVYDKNGKKQKMELVLALEKEDTDYEYIVYKPIDKKVPLYMAKLKLEEGITKLETNLQEEEKDMLINIIKKDLLEEE